MKDVALGMAVKLENLQVPERGDQERYRQGRLVKVLNELLKFWPEGRVRAWMLKENPGFRGIRPIDMVGSEYSTQDLLRAIIEIKRRYRSEKKSDRLRRLLQGPSVLELQDMSRRDMPVELL